MSKAFKKKKEEKLDESGIFNLNFLLGGQQRNNQNEKIKLDRNLILKYAMFWNTKNKVDKIKSLALIDMSLEEFDDSDDFSISELTSIELLSLSKNKITHLQPISCLETLITLNINHNNIYNLAPL